MRCALKLVITSCIVVVSPSTFAQRVEGTVYDKQTGTTLPFVHIGVAGKNMGVVSHDDGTFSIDLSSAAGGDRLVFSSIGYHSLSFDIKALTNPHLDVYLEQRVYQLREVIVREDRAPVLTKLGRSVPTKTTTGQSGREEFGNGDRKSVV